MEYNQPKKYRGIMSDFRVQALEYASSHFYEFQNYLTDLVSIPSVSTNLVNDKDVKKCADFVAEKLKTIGIENVQVFSTNKHPIIYGDHLHAGNERPTILIYGHYDVQPIDPLDLWNSPPFDCIKKDDYLYGRGTSDMKGQFSACISAIESILKTGKLPVNIKFLLEGEEEIGSPSLHNFLLEHKSLFKSDIALNPDAGMLSKDQPAIVYGLRGLAYFEARVFGPERDLHSGSFGGLIHNPAQVLCDILAGMHDSKGRITLPDFYDSVQPLNDRERRELERLNLSDQYYCSQTGVPQLWGEEGFSAVERVSARPTLEINGLYSGFTGEGAKTIIPSYAMAKISTRIVPDQKPQEVYRQLLDYFETHAPKTVRWEIDYLSGGSASITDYELPETSALAIALESVWKTKPVFKREGGSIPVTAEFQDILGMDSILTGFGLPDDNIHSPNERLHIPTWQKGILSLIHFFFNVSERK
jgi:acetylornithine deacetylase/succinyl-diaminopimelate desuccinylase-like protein